MAKLAATEGAQQVIDRAVQLFGGLGVRSGEMVERLYREIRPSCVIAKEQALPDREVNRCKVVVAAVVSYTWVAQMRQLSEAGERAIRKAGSL